MPTQGHPLSTLLSQALIAFTIELDNEFEHRFLESGGGARVTSWPIWAGLLRVVGGVRTVGEFVAATGLPKQQALSRLGGIERWRYVTVGPSGAAKREGYGSARGTKDDWVVRFTPAGERGAAIWPELPGEIEGRWRHRFGPTDVDDLLGELRAQDDGGDLALPDYLPIVSSTYGMALELPVAEARSSAQLPLIALLAHALMAYTLEFEKRSPVSLPLAANVVRVLDTEGVPVRDLPELTGISKEAVAVSLTTLGKTEYVTIAGAPASKRIIRLTPAGERLRTEQRRVQQRIEKRWGSRLRAPLERILGHQELGAGLEPYPEGWRSGKQYAVRTARMLAEPRGALPHHPMVLHRGGWPDGS